MIFRKEENTHYKANDEHYFYLIMHNCGNMKSQLVDKKRQVAIKGDQLLKNQQ